MRNRESIALGMLLGAGLMYLLDPSRGRRRRALIRDQVVHGAHELEDLGGGVASRARHLRNRARGALHETRARLNVEEVDDRIVETRVRAGLGRLISDARNVEVSSEHGRVTLRGQAPREEVEQLVEGVQRVPGVHDVINRLQEMER